MLVRTELAYICPALTLLLLRSRSGSLSSTINLTLCPLLQVNQMPTGRGIVTWIVVVRRCLRFRNVSYKGFLHGKDKHFTDREFPGWGQFSFRKCFSSKEQAERRTSTCSHKEQRNYHVRKIQMCMSHHPCSMLFLSLWKGSVLVATSSVPFSSDSGEIPSGLVFRF